MNAEEYVVTRNVTRDECPWLEYDLPEGIVLVEYHGATYGCVDTQRGKAMSLDGSTPFFEVPLDALGRR